MLRIVEVKCRDLAYIFVKGGLSKDRVVRVKKRTYTAWTQAHVRNRNTSVLQLEHKHM